MAKYYRSREGETGSLDTKAQLTTLGSDTAPGPLLVPQGTSRLLGMWSAFMGNFAATGSSSVFVRLEGPGLPQGPETMALGCHSVPVATGGNGTRLAQYQKLDLQVTPGNEIQIFMEFAGADSGATSVGVTLVFE